MITNKRYNEVCAEIMGWSLFKNKKGVWCYGIEQKHINTIMREKNKFNPVTNKTDLDLVVGLLVDEGYKVSLIDESDQWRPHISKKKTSRLNREVVNYNNFVSFDVKTSKLIIEACCEAKGITL